MTDPERDPILEAFTRRLAAVERLVPARPPELSLDAESPRVTVVGGTALRGRRAGSGSVARTIAMPIGLAAAVVVALVGVSILAGGATGPGGTASSSPAAPYRSIAFRPPVQLDLAAGWSIVTDAPRELTMAAPIGDAASRDTGALTIATLDNVSVNSCQATGVAGPTRPWAPATPAAGPQALMDWIESESGVPHDPPSPATIAGIVGLTTTLSPGVGSLGSCGGVAILSDLGGGRDLRIGENEAMRVTAIAVGDKTVVIMSRVPRAVLLGGFDATIDPIVKSIAFRPTGS